MVWLPATSKVDVPVTLTAPLPERAAPPVTFRVPALIVVPPE